MPNEKELNKFEDQLDIEDLKFFMNLTPEQKLDELEKLVLALEEITPPEAKAMAQKLKELGF